MRILSVFGTRPEAIKMYPIIKELELRNNASKICISGQHNELLHSVLREFSIKIDYDLKIHRRCKSLEEITCCVVKGFSGILKVESPDIVLVHGDTTTAFAAAVAAYYQKIPIAHIEAGLRTHNTENPYPEEFNRRAIDSISDILFSPTREAIKNLLCERIDESKIHLTGNTIFDVAKLLYKKEYRHPILNSAPQTKLILLTTHRRENIPKLSYIYCAVKKLCSEENIRVIFPVHPNPKIRKTAKHILGGNNNILLTEPLKTVDFHNILARCYMVLTDSGGVQEEATYYGKPTLILRNATERIEAINTKTVKLVGTDENVIYNTAREMLNNDIYQNTSVSKSISKPGAAKKIVDIILDKNEYTLPSIKNTIITS